MAKNSNEITQGLFEAVDAIIGERISSLPYDQTILCQIVSATDHANGIYTVTHNYDTLFTAYADFTGYNVNDYVYVRIPEGDYTQQKVITGKYLEGMIISGETQNIATTPSQSYLLYNKNNQINQYAWSKVEHEMVFTYFNSTDLEEKWEDVISQYNGDDIEYERPKAIKIVVNTEKDIVIYLYKYTNDNGNIFHFAAEQYGVTSPTFMQTVENKASYIDVSSYVEVPQGAEFDNEITYYIKQNNNYRKVDIAAFREDTTYYTMRINSKVPNGTLLYQKYDNNYEPIEMNLIETETEDGIITTYVYDYDDSTPIYYYNIGYLEVELPSSITMLSSMKVYYDNTDTGSVHIIYTIAPELDTDQIQIPITVQYCPVDEYSNISKTLYLSFGYITELDDNINVSIQLVHVIDDIEEIVPAVTLQESENIDSYYLQVLLIDKLGEKISLDTFGYRWDNKSNEKNSKYSISKMTSIPNEGIVYRLDIGFWNNNIFTIYKTLYYPLAIRSNDLLYINGPSIITYNEAGVNPDYYDGLINLKKYNNAQVSYTIEAEENNNLYKIQNNILAVYNIFSRTAKSYFIIKDAEDDSVLWFQSLYFTQKRPNSYNLDKNFPEQNLSGPRSGGALAAQSTNAAGVIIQYDNDVLSINGYDLNKTPNRIFHLGSDGNLQIGYNNFTMTGHVTEGSRYLEDSEKKKYKCGSKKQPIYFENGIPIETRKFFEDDYIKIIPEYNTSVIISINDINNSSNLNGRFIKGTSGSITLPVNAEIGFECEVYKDSADETSKIIFNAPTGDMLYCIDKPGGSTRLQLIEPRGVVAIKKISSTNWLLTGSVEEYTQ